MIVIQLLPSLAYRPVGMGDTYVLRDGTKTVEFKVVLTDPSGICIVTDDTIIDTGKLYYQFFLNI
jgi:hypothetical protein